MMAIVSDSGSLLIYESMNLIWTAKLLEIPVAITRGNFDGLPGGIAYLGEEGHITVGYLGSEPEIFKVPPLNLKELNYEKTQMELAELEKEIKEGIDVTDIRLVNAATERDLIVQVKMNEKVEKSNFSNTSLMELDIEPKMCEINVNFKCNVNLDQLQIHISVVPPLTCSTEIYTLRNLTKGHAERFNSWIYFGESPSDIPSLDVTVIVSFINRQSIPRVIEKIVQLPLDFVYVQSPPQKEGIVKITVTTENFTRDLGSLFPDITSDKGIQVIGLKSLYTDSIVTVVAAKSSNRFRIQSDSLTALTTVLNVLLNRLRNGNEEKSLSASTSKIITSPQFPMEQIIIAVVEHFEARKSVKELTVR